MRTWLGIGAILVAAILSPYRADAQAPPGSDDPLRHGHALLIGNSHYWASGWPPLDDIPLQLAQLKNGLKEHFDTVKVVEDLQAIPLLATINDFLREYGNDSDARLFIYYAGHGYTEIQRNEYRGYITGIDTPGIDGSQQAYDAARLKAISMAEIRAPLERAPAKSILFLFDSCFAGTIFTNRAGSDPPRPLERSLVKQLMERPARDIITAGRSDQRVPAHSPIPDLFLAALNGAADPYKHGVVSSSEIHAYLLDRVLQMRDINLTPQVGKLPNPSFAEGTFLFRVANAAVQADIESACRVDGERLARLRSDPVPKEIERFQLELMCERLRSPLQRLIESIAPGQPPSAIASRKALSGSDTEMRKQVQTPLAEPQEACARDRERLRLLRGAPTLEAIARFEKDLGCQELRPLLQRLRESVGS
jgi:hypothetical protein